MLIFGLLTHYIGNIKFIIKLIKIINKNKLI